MKGLDTLSEKELLVFDIPSSIPKCPFCGSDVYIGKHSYHKGAYNIKCSSNGGNECIIFPSTGPIDFNEVEIAIKQWCNSEKQK